MVLPGMAIFAWVLGVGALWAHGTDDLSADDLWTAWRLSADIYLPAALVILVYIRGMIRRRNLRRPVSAWRHLAFFGGALLVFLALQSPIDTFAERAFWIHQVQHGLLRMAGPMLLALSRPEGLLVAGLPRIARSAILRPLAMSGTMRLLAAVLRNGWVVFGLFMGTLYFWQVPVFHDAALLNAPLHYFMHATLLLSGLIFFWRIFELRLPPHGLRYGVRLVMLIGAVLLNIAIGAATTLKQTVLYLAYDVQGRLLIENALSDEQTGGFVIWIPGSMMALVSILITVVGWNRYEVYRDQRRYSMRFSNSAALEFPETAEELWMKVRKPNRRVGLGLSAIPIAIFLFVLGSMFMGHTG
jgi:putative membrane protein